MLYMIGKHLEKCIIYFKIETKNKKYFKNKNLNIYLNY
jgi:hypothetical protein